MKTIKILFIMLNVILLSNCKEQNNANKTTGNNLIESTLLRQVEAGWSLHDDSDDVYNASMRLSKQDFDANEQEVQNILKSSGYIFDSVKFKNKVKDIFGIDGYKKAVSPNDKCDVSDFSSLNYDYDNDIKMGVLLFDNEMMFEFYMLPELIDYQTKYPEIAKAELAMPKKRKLYKENNYECSVISWSEYSPTDRENNICTLIYRNKYLFNDDKASLTWLINNDIDFLDLLVREFGYNKEPKINKAVLEKALKQYKSTQPPDESAWENLFVSKDCNGHLQIREGLLKTVADETNAKHNELFSTLENYCDHLTFAEEGEKMPFSFSERCKIIAYICNTVYPVFEKYRPEGSIVNWNMASILYTVVAIPEIVEEISKNNYYGLTQLKSYMDTVKEQYEEDRSRAGGGDK